MNDQPRILHVISRLDGYGGSRALRWLAARQARAGQGVSVAALAADAAIVRELRTAGATVAVLGARWRWDPLAVWRLARLRRRTPAGLLHAWDPTALAYAVAAGWREPSVATWNHDGRPDSWIERLSARSVATLPPAAPPAPAQTIDRAAALAELDLPSDARVIAVAGPLVRDKELDEIIWAYELVRVLHPDARMVIFGDGPDRLRLERYASFVSEPGCVRFVGFRADLPSLLPHADLYWQLDAARNVPYALLEAMAAHVPVVAADVPALRAVLTPGETGLLVALHHRAGLARASDQLLSDAKLASRIGAAGAAHVLRAYSLEKLFAACDELYDALNPGHSLGVR